MELTTRVKSLLHFAARILATPEVPRLLVGLALLGVGFAYQPALKGFFLEIDPPPTLDIQFFCDKEGSPDHFEKAIAHLTKIADNDFLVYVGDLSGQTTDADDINRSIQRSPYQERIFLGAHSQPKPEKPDSADESEAADSDDESQIGVCDTLKITARALRIPGKLNPVRYSIDQGYYARAMLFNGKPRMFSFYSAPVPVAERGLIEWTQSHDYFGDIYVAEIQGPVFFGFGFRFRCDDCQDTKGRFSALIKATYRPKNVDRQEARIDEHYFSDRSHAVSWYQPTHLSLPKDVIESKGIPVWMPLGLKNQIEIAKSTAAFFIGAGATFLLEVLLAGLRHLMRRFTNNKAN